MIYNLRDRPRVTALNMAGGPTERASLKATAGGGPDKPQKVK